MGLKVLIDITTGLQSYNYLSLTHHPDLCLTTIRVTPLPLSATSLEGGVELKQRISPASVAGPPSAKTLIALELPLCIRKESLPSSEDHSE